MRKLPISIALLLLLVSPTPPAAGQRASRPPSIDPWEITEQTGQPTLTLELQALNTVPGSVFQVRPVLLVHCRDNELEVFVSAGSILDSDDNIATPVGIQWGGGGGAQAPEQARWNRSTDSMSAFAPDPRGFLQQLLASPELRLEIHPSHRSAQVVHFNARGLDRHMPAVEVACRGRSHETSGGQIYAEDAVDERPQLVSAPPLVYPPLLQHAGLQGRVMVQAIIDTLGHAEPRSLKIIERPNAVFDQSARQYVLHALFRPARVKGRAVRALVRVPVEYRIE